MVLVLAYVPFYLFVRILTNSNILFLVAQDVVVVTLLTVGIYGLTRHHKLNLLDYVLIWFTIYNVALLSFSFLRGGPSYVPTHFHNYISGILMYFLVIRFVSRGRVAGVINLFMALAVVVSGLYLYEWFQVNVLGGAAFAWMTELGRFSATGVFIKGSSELDVVRVAGIFGHLHPTAAFAAAGAIAFFTKALVSRKKRLLYLLGLFVCAGAVVLAGARVPALAMVLVGVLVAVSLVSSRNVSWKRLFTVGAYLLCALLILSFMVLRNFDSFKILYVDRLIGHNTAGPLSWLKTHAESPLKRARLMVEQNPLAPITGAGFPLRAVDVGILGGDPLGPVRTDDLFPVQMLTQYGLLGMGLALAVFLAWRNMAGRMLRWRPGLEREDIAALVIAGGVVSVFVLSSAHSGAMLRYGIYYWLFTMLGLISVLYTSYRFGNNPKM